MHEVTQASFYAGKRKMLETLLSHGKVRIQVDPRVEGVKVPPLPTRVPWDLPLNLSWAFRKPMELQGAGIAVTLSFGGVEHECFLPWGSVYGFSSYGSDEITFTSDAPPEVLAEVEAAVEAGAPARVADVPPEAPAVLETPTPAPEPARRGNVVRGPWAGSV